MRGPAYAILVLALWGCASHETSITNKWADDRLWSVLDAQDHRDTDRLCALLKDSSAVVREAAAMAFASVQDSLARPCLIGSLKDGDGHVRASAAYALGLVADSISLVELNKASDTEQDTAVQRVMVEVGFRAELALRKHDATWLISFLESDDPDIRTRSAQSLARLPKEESAAVANDVMHAVGVEQDQNVRTFLVAALKHNTTMEVTDKLKALAAGDSLPMVRVAALRALGAKQDPTEAVFFVDRLHDADQGARQTAVEQLQRIEGTIDGETLWKAAQEHPDPRIKVPLCELVMEHGDEATKAACATLLSKLAEGDGDPYLNAALIQARSSTLALDTLIGWMRPPRSAPERQAAFAAALANVRGTMMHARYASREAQYAGLASVGRAALLSGDAGLVAAAAEELVKEEGDVIALLMDKDTEQHAFASLLPIRDLEAHQLLEEAIAKRDGLAPPKHKGPAFNHPISRERLMHLSEGQQYRITTTKGEIVLALEPGAAPGSCVAFDSLVTAGYYNGKAFHRVIANFVAQGGCPRGDGYGSMDWTLRTEIGTQGFEAGAVGLASAGRDTESCQFFITLAPAPHLDGHYTRFAHVVSGLAVARDLQVGDVMERVVRMP
ncbi:MAG: peptidylprolyl isomerase [Flavobacteriales bacterium]